MSKVKRVTDPQNNAIAFAYDLNGDIVSGTDANGKTTLYEYNYGGQVTRVTDALSNVTLLTYGSGCPSCGTGVDKLTSVTDPRGNMTTFQYDLAGRLTKVTHPLGYFRSYTYDAAGNPLTLTDENGQIIRYTYDGVNRLTQARYPDATTKTFGYDGRGNVTSAVNPNISYTLIYDLNNRLTSIAGSGKTVSYQYDGVNNRTQMTAPDGRVIAYGYDTGNRLSQIVFNQNTYGLTHDNAGRRTGLTFPNGVTTTYAYNPSSFLTSLLARNLQQVTVNSFSYTHDAMGNRSSMTDLLGLHEYTYDNIYQITQATHPSIPTEAFGFDPAGNRLNTTVDAENALLEDSDYTYVYDFNGNLVQKVNKSTGVTTTYTYDYENRLKRVQYLGMDAQYKYDPFGRRIEKNVNGTITKYVYDGENIVTGYDGSWNVISKYVHSLAIDEPLSIEQGGNTYYYHPDGLGSQTDLTDSSGNVIRTYRYKSFGEIYSQTGGLVQPFTFTGREYDPESGLYFYRARYFDPRAGRFLTKDPIGFAGGDVNLYRYVFNNPTNFADPFGYEVTIRIFRIAYTKKSVIGVITVASDRIPDTFTGYTLEATRAGDYRDKDPIAAATYSAYLRYDHNPYRLELEKVPGFTHIQIHKGKDWEDVKGCFAVGTNYKRDWVGSSETAMKQILKIIEKDITGIISVEVNAPDVLR